MTRRPSRRRPKRAEHLYTVIQQARAKLREKYRPYFFGIKVYTHQGLTRFRWRDYEAKTSGALLDCDERDEIAVATELLYEMQSLRRASERTRDVAA
jgi:hypothetical protein